MVKRKEKKQKTGKLHFFWLVISVACLAGGYYGGVKRQEWKTVGRGSFPAHCIRVIDGDTVEVSWMYGTNQLRIAGIDCPESRNTNKMRNQAKNLGLKPKTMLKIGKNAKKLANDYLMNQDVVIIFPSGKIEYDAFGRLLAYVEIRGNDFGGFLVANGMAYARPEGNPRKSLYRKLCAKAEKEKRGIYAW